MVRSDYRPAEPGCTTSPVRSRLPSDVSVRRARRRAGDPARAARRARAGDGRRVALVGGEAGLGQEPPRARVRGRGGAATARSSSTAPATRSCARRTARSSRRSSSSRARSSPASCAPPSGRRGGELTRLLPGLPARIGELPAPVAADPDTERHRLHTAVADLLAASARRRPVAARGRGRPLGGRPDAAAPAPPRARRAGEAPAADRSRPSATPRPTSRTRSPRRSPTCGAPRTWSACASPGSRTRRSPSSCAAPPAATRRRPRELARDDQRPDRGQRRSWSASCGARWSRPRRGRSPAAASARRARRPSSAPRRASARSSASGSRGCAPATSDLLELAATAGRRVRADDRPRAAGAARPSCWRRSTRPCAAG